MEGRSSKRKVALAATLAVILTSAASLLAPVHSGALERDGGCRASPNPVYNNGPNGPLVFYIGDSISVLEQDYYAFVNGGYGWKTRVLATGGSTINEHRCLNWLSWYWAHESSARAVVVELGTNDISGINASMTQAQAFAEFAKVFDATKWAADYLKSKCVVWVGLNEQFNTFVTIGGKRVEFTDKAATKAFDNNLKGLTSNHSNLHYADYSAFIRANPTFRNSLTSGDGIHPSTAAGKRELAAWVARRIDNNCI